jgi:branched-chain amino acid transport system ATP-binding protein
VKETLLQLQKASVHYGGVRALDDVSVAIDEGEIVALMGPNGAGKSTVLKALFGLAPMTEGSVMWHEQKLLPVPYEMAARGIAYVPQGRQVFKNLTVYENLELGGYALPNRSDVKKNIDSVLRLFPALKERLQTKAGVLSGGQQQMLTIARGLVSDPKVLLLDEPSLGLAPKIVKEVFVKIKEIVRMCSREGTCS